MTTRLDLSYVRSKFPALRRPWALLDNAGGSVPAASVIDRIAAYMRGYGVQLGASYELSQQAEAIVREGEAAAARLIGATPDQTIVGPSTTANLQMLARALGPLFASGDEVVITNLDHEANIGCWETLAARGVRLKTWQVRADASLHLEDLSRLLSSRTRLVSFTHCANVVGEIVDVEAVVRVVKEQRTDTLVCVDGVAYAPHREVDVDALGVDFYALSLYKVFGPHAGVLFGKREHLLQAANQNHWFVPNDKLPYKLQPGNVNHELAAGIVGIEEYFEDLCLHHGFARRELHRAIAAHEAALAERLLGFLRDRAGVRIVGPVCSDAHLRVPTVAFVVSGCQSQDIVHRIDQDNVAIRFGHFYAKRAIDALGLAEYGGVIRASAVHYNTLSEIDRLVEALDQALPR